MRRGRPGPSAAVPAVAVTGLVAGLLVAWGPAAPARAAEASPCETGDAESTSLPATGPSLPLVSMQVPEAQDLVGRTGGDRRVAGAGIGVAVIDSGIGGGDVVPARAVPLYGTSTGVPTYGQGTTVAGLIAGPARGTSGDPDPDARGVPYSLDDTGVRPTGIAPGADLYDVKVYDTVPEASSTSEKQVYPQTAGVVAGLNWVLQNLRPADGAPIKVVNVSMQVEPSKELDDAVAALADEGVLVVAASGDRPTSEDSQTLSQFYLEGGVVPPAEDAARAVGPADSDDAIAVTATAAGEGDPAAVLRSSQTDLAVPVMGGVSYGPNGESCQISTAVSRWAAAEVSGVLAMVWSYLGPDTPANLVRQVVERTATGNGEDSNPVFGYGIAQPLEALTRPLAPDADGDLPETSTDVAGDEPATAPRPEQDVLASTRRNAVWWGLVGGSALIVALILRPLLARRRAGR